MQGHFDLNTLPVGGPHVVQITQPGFRSQVINNVFLKASPPVGLAPVAVGPRRADRREQDAVAPWT